MGKSIIFYSWQSDLPSGLNRAFIEKALQNASRSIQLDGTIGVEPVIDRDTMGIPGAPEIANTIFDKIQNAAAFVCDVSIINSGAKTRLTPNPNVLLELGYAMKALGSERVVMIMNTTFGDVDVLPFDLRPRRVLRYAAKSGEPDRSNERYQLESQLHQALSAILSRPAQNRSTTLFAKLQEAIQSKSPDQGFLCRELMDQFIRKLATLAPNFDPSVSSHPDEPLVAAIEKTKLVTIEFAKLAEYVSATQSEESAKTIYRSFEILVDSFVRPKDYHDTYMPKDDFFRFIAHEWFAVFFCFLVRDERWRLIATLLELDLYVSNPDEGPLGLKSFEYICQSIETFDQRNERLALKSVCLHCRILHERYQDLLLSQAIPYQQFAEADVFLFFRSAFRSSSADWMTWRPWSSLFMQEIPRFLSKAQRLAYAVSLSQVLGLASINEFRPKFAIAAELLNSWFRGSSRRPIVLRYNPETFATT